jgi:hypothetical protein
VLRDTGSPRADAESDFLRARRQQVLAGLAARMLGKDSDDRKALPFQDVVDALGLVNEVSRGIQVIPVDRIVGSVDKVRDFDPQFRPRSGSSRRRWERIAEAARRGEPLPPIDVYQVGDMYFVRDGHHRVSVYRALELPSIEADVRLVQTLVEPDEVHAHSDLSDKELRRLLMQRVPLGKTARRALRLSDPQRYPLLAEMVEAWSARLMFAEGALMDRAQAARRWYEEEFAPVTGLIQEGNLLEKGETPADAYMRVAGERYSVFHDHVWGPNVIEVLGQRGKRS